MQLYTLLFKLSNKPISSKFLYICISIAHSIRNKLWREKKGQNKQLDALLNMH